MSLKSVPRPRQNVGQNSNYAVSPRPLTEQEGKLVQHLSRLQFFLATAPTRWTPDQPLTLQGDGTGHVALTTLPHPNLNRFLLPNGEFVACVFWNGLYHITGTDIVRALVFRFEAFSRPVTNMKKFEEGVFSDLRNLKPGSDACLEEPKSPFLELLFKNGCIRTQKKQKVFYWFSVPHDRLFLDALERDLKREKMGMVPTTAVRGEPARSFRYDPKVSLYEQFAGKTPGLEEAVRFHMEPSGQELARSSMLREREDEPERHATARLATPSTSRNIPVASSVLRSRTLLEGSPAYKQRKRKSFRDSSTGPVRLSSYETSGRDSANFTRGLRQASAPSHVGENAENRSVFLSNTAAVPILERVVSAPNPYIMSGPKSYIRHESNQLASLSRYSMPAPNIPTTWPRPNTLRNEWGHSSMTLIGDLSATPPGTPSTDATVGGGDKAFSCPLFSCGRLFRRLEHLKRHVRTHTQERPYECTHCLKRFSRSDNLAQHLRTHSRSGRDTSEISDSNGEGAPGDDGPRGTNTASATPWFRKESRTSPSFVGLTEDQQCSAENRRHWPNLIDQQLEGDYMAPLGLPAPANISGGSESALNYETSSNRFKSSHSSPHSSHDQMRLSAVGQTHGFSSGHSTTTIPPFSISLASDIMPTYVASIGSEYSAADEDVDF